MKLYTYFNSSAAYRVRIALALKSLDYEPAYVHLVRDGGEHKQPAYTRVNPQQLVPALETEDGTIIQSLAICEYLDERHPQPPILPGNPGARAYVRAVAAAIACDIHPLNNLRVLRYLVGPLGLDEERKSRWYAHWIAEGLSAVETLVAASGRAGEFCCGDTPTLADICLVPQLFNARRFNCDVTPYPTLAAIEARAMTLPAFRDTAPGVQPDAG